MQFIYSELFYVPVLFIQSAVGIAIAWYLHTSIRKNKNGTVWCVLGSHCKDVILSSYGRHFGVENEIVGICYYIFLIFLGAMYFVTHLSFLVDCIALIALGAFLFSLYLLSLQIFVLRKYCFLCLCAIALNTLICFFTAWFAFRIF
ncbi:vitamin K epoxide reductase family protein [Candidatus Gottesmanbacteria bacterium]|nr:vitamin K epoxide reductase family protein [Candidatus Gottesmanbacteria bacterium]